MSQSTIAPERPAATRFDRLFREHPREAKETYFQHMKASAAFGLRLLMLAVIAFVHAVLPGLHRTTVSTAVRRMADEIDGRASLARESRMRDAGAWDVGL